MTEFTRDLAAGGTPTGTVPLTSQQESLQAVRTPLGVLLLGTCYGGLLLLGMLAATMRGAALDSPVIWLAVGIYLAALVPAGIYQTLVTRFLWHRKQRYEAIVLPYLELSVTGTWLVLVTLIGIGSIANGSRNESLQIDWGVFLEHLVVASFLAGLAWCGVIRRWPTIPRLAILIGSGLLLTSLAPWGPNPVLGSTGGLAAVLGIVAVVQSRKPAPVSTAN